MAGEEHRFYDWQAELDFPEALTGIYETSEPPPEHAIEANHQNGLRGNLARLGVLALAGLAIFVEAKQFAKSTENQSSPAPTACEIVPSHNAMQAVERLFGNGQHLDGNDVKDAAKEAGVHAPGFGLMWGSDFDNVLYTPEQGIKAADVSLNKFGIDLQIGNVIPEVDGLYNPTAADLKAHLPQTLDTITSALVDLPTEIGPMTGIELIVLMSNPDSTTQFVFLGPHVVAWNIDAQKPDAMEELVYEGLDHSECGDDSNRDPAYAALNGKGIDIYGKAGKKWGTKSLEQFGSVYDGHYDIDPESKLLYSDPEVSAAYKRGNVSNNYDQYCSILHDDLEQVIVATQAGFNGVEEDKIGLGGELLVLFDGNYSNILDPTSPDLRKKALFLLGRLYDKNPNVVKFIASTAGTSISLYNPCYDNSKYRVTD